MPRFEERQWELPDSIHRFESPPSSTRVHDALGAIERMQVGDRSRCRVSACGDAEAGRCHSGLSSAAISSSPMVRMTLDCGSDTSNGSASRFTPSKNR